MKEKFSKFISIITVAPIIAALTVTWIYLTHKSYFGYTSKWFVVCFIFLTLMPISAYALEYILPPIKKNGRDGERKLAFIMAVLGYVLGTLFCIVFKAPKPVMIIFLSYFMSGIVLSFVNKVIKIKASGHACGVSGPITMLIYFIGKYALCTLIFIPVVFWARISMNRHTYKELFLGAFIGFIATGLVILVGNPYLH